MIAVLLLSGLAWAWWCQHSHCVSLPRSCFRILQSARQWNKFPLFISAMASWLFWLPACAKPHRNQVLNLSNIFNAQNRLVTKSKPALGPIKEAGSCSSDCSPTLLLPPFPFPYSSWDLVQLTSPNPGGLYQISFYNLSGTSNHISDFPSYNISNYIIRLGLRFFFTQSDIKLPLHINNISIMRL